MFQVQNFIFILLTICVITSCYKDDIISTETIDIMSAERAYLNTIKGNVVDTLGDPISSVIIELGATSIMTDGGGNFELVDVVIPESGIFISASHDTYYEGGIRVYANAPLTQVVQISLVPKGATDSFNNDEGATVDVQGVGKVVVPSNSFSKSGQPYNGLVVLEVYLVDPGASENFNKRIQVFESLDLTFGTDIMKSDFVSMMYIKAYDEEGNELQVSPDKEVSVQFPTYDSDLSDQIELFSFDKNIGFWKSEGNAENVNGSYYLANLKHFSWWGIGTQKKSSTLCLSFLSDTVRVNDVFTISKTNGSIVYFGGVNYESESCFPVPEGDNLEVRVFNSCLIEIAAASVDAVIGDMASATIVVDPSGVQGYTIIGEVVDCDITLLEDEVKVYYSTDLSIDSLGTFLGNFEIALDPCFQPQDIFIGIEHKVGNMSYTFGEVVVISPSQTEYNIQIVACQDVMPEDGHLTINGVTFNNVIGRQNPQETLIITKDQIPEIIIGIDGFENGTFPARVINFQGNIFCEGTAEITHYGEIGDFIEGTINIPAMESLGCEALTGDFIAKREK